jgi:hypothetical protein
MIFLAAFAFETVFSPQDAWSQSFAVRCAAVLVMAVAGYRLGAARANAQFRGKQQRRRGFRRLIAPCLVALAALPAVCLSVYCSRARRQTETVERLEWLDGCEVGYDDDQDPTFWQRVLVPVLGPDFFYRAVDVDIDAADVAVALPQLKALPWLRRVWVESDFYGRPVTDEASPSYVEARAEIDREWRPGKMPLLFLREIETPNGAGDEHEYVDSSDIEAGRIDRRAIQKRVADGAKLFVLPGPSRFEGPVTVEEFFSGTEEEIRYEVSRRMCVKVAEKLRQELPGVQVETSE